MKLFYNLVLLLLDLHLAPDTQKVLNILHMLF